MYDSTVEYLRMGGYAFYVWWSYGVVLAVLALNFIVPTIRHRRLRRVLARQILPADPSHREP